MNDRPAFQWMDKKLKNLEKTKVKKKHVIVSIFGFQSHHLEVQELESSVFGSLDELTFKFILLKKYCKLDKNKLYVCILKKKIKKNSTCTKKVKLITS